MVFFNHCPEKVRELSSGADLGVVKPVTRLKIKGKNLKIISPVVLYHAAAPFYSLAFIFMQH